MNILKIFWIWVFLPGLLTSRVICSELTTSVTSIIGNLTIGETPFPRIDVMLKWKKQGIPGETIEKVMLNHVHITEERIQICYFSQDHIGKYFFSWVPVLPQPMLDRSSSFSSMADFNRELGLPYRSNKFETIWCMFGRDQKGADALAIIKVKIREDGKFDVEEARATIK